MSKRRFARLVLSAILTFAGTVAFEACSPSQTQQAKSAVTVRLGYRPKALADITPVIIRERDIHRDTVRVEAIPVPTPEVALQMLSANELDAVAGIPMAAVLEQLQATDPGFIGYWHQVDVPGAGWVSLVGNASMGINKIADLANVPAAALPTQQAQWLLKRIILAAGVPPESVKVVVYNPATPLAGMDAKEHGAIFGLEPAISSAAAAGNPILAKGAASQYLYQGKPVILSASLVSAKFAAAHPDAYKDFVAIVEEAVHFAETNPDDVRAFLTKRDYGELQPQIASRIFLPVMVKPLRENRPTAEQYIRDLVHDGLLNSEVNLDPLFPNK